MKLKLTLMLVLTACLGAFAQSPKEELTLSGAVADSLSVKALAYTTVSLKDEKKVAIKLLTDLNGKFLFKGLAPGHYNLTITAVGYDAKTLVAVLNQATDLGKILIRRSATALKTVTITGDKPLIRQEPDRISYNLDADPESKGSNVLSMMRKIPFLSLDGEENVLFKGKDDFKVLINGRPSAMVERNLKEILRSMPASTIQKIEVITNPPSKYTSEGLTGIINIITYKPIAGFKGTLNISERFPVGGPAFGSSLTLKKGKFGISAMGGTNLNQSPETESVNKRISTSTDQTSLIQNGWRSSEGYGGYIGADLSYEIDKLYLLVLQLNKTGNLTKNKAQQYSNLFDKSGLLQSFDLNNEKEVEGSDWDAVINFQRGFRSDKNRLLTFSYQYSAYHNKLQSFQKLINHLNYPFEDFRQDNLGKFNEHTFQADYVQLIRKVLLEAGVKGIIRQNNSDFTYYTFDSREYQAQPLQSSGFNNSQTIFGMYNSYQFALKKFEFKAGLRLEQTAINANFISDTSDVSKNYFSIIPAISVSRKFNATNALSFGYGQRIKRPGINKLNPFVDRSNPKFVSSGNPGLRQSEIHQFQLSYSRTKKVTVNAGIDYSFAINIPLQLARYDPASGITYTSYVNTGRASGLSSNVYINYPVSKALRLSLNGNCGFNWLNGRNNNIPVSIHLFTYNVSSSANYNFSQKWRINAGISAISKNITSLQGQSNGLVSSYLGLNKDIIESKLTFSATANNPFTKYRGNQITTAAPDFFQSSFSQDYFRSVSTSLNYSFGKLKDSIKKNKRSIKNDDLTN